eukprot:gnl/TRDRNA2_/TRDRNA2_127586_c0_seq1.p1 gnl/TRDRNA2_/TRDRNA2_127586_c0~~gnl/TRDRNA2_/TRDRNA2_127586_c0_seq1.p1  ORF type:complete len:519 (+),score=79.90 gnl/TRDRNA2_/TRDRNA2_127586_c0_seq1:88-1644(+)
MANDAHAADVAKREQLQTEHPLQNHRPGAIVTAGTRQIQDGGKAEFTGMSPMVKPRVSVANPSGKNREIVKIQKPATISDFYDFGSIIGKGGFSVVSQIHHAKTFQPYAGKVVRKASLETSHNEEERFRRVMELLLNNEHPNIVRLLHIFEDDDHYYLVMDQCQGGTLRGWMKEHKIAPAHIVEDLLMQIVGALYFLHELRLVHRDIKPDNIMLLSKPSASGKVKVNVVDFDMCLFLDERGEAKSRHLEGTPGYLAPEVLTSRIYTIESDIFAFGCVMYALLKHAEPCPEMSLNDRPTRELTNKMEAWLEEAHQICDQATAAAEVMTSGSLSPDKSQSGISSPTNCRPWTVGGAPKMTGGLDGLDPRTPKTPGTALRRGSKSLAQAGATALGFGSPPGAEASPETDKEPPQRPGSRASSKEMPAQPQQAADGSSEATPVGLWRLMAWCLNRDPALRPNSAMAIYSSNLIRLPEATNPSSPMTCKSGKRRSGASGDRKRVGSINDLLYLNHGGATPVPR